MPTFLNDTLWIAMWTGLVAGSVACSDTGERADGAGASGGTTSGGAGGIGASGGEGASGGAGATGGTGAVGGDAAGGGGAGGAGDTGGAPSLAEQCQNDACAHLPGCAACETLCDDWCVDGLGCGPECGVDFMIDCLQPATCADIESLFTLTKDNELYACFWGVPDNQTCGFGASSFEYCWECTYDECGGALAACEADAACEPWLACITAQDCPVSNLQLNPECYRECDDKFPAAAPLYEAVYACTCSSCLDDACGVHQDPCSVVD